MNFSHFNIIFKPYKLFENLIGEEGLTFLTEKERDDAILNLVHVAGTHVVFENLEIIAYNTLVNPDLKGKEPPIFHVSKALIRLKILKNHRSFLFFFRAYYHGWVFNKISLWKESMDQHILIVLQVCLL